jgi:hypothetical protein
MSTHQLPLILQTPMAGVAIRLAAAAFEERVHIADLEAETSWKSVHGQVAARSKAVYGGAGQEQPLGDIVYGQQVIRRPDRAPFAFTHRQLHRL